jgi:hypothetical protein
MNHAELGELNEQGEQEEQEETDAEPELEFKAEAETQKSHRS